MTIALDTAHTLEAQGIPILSLESLLVVLSFLAASGAIKSSVCSSGQGDSRRQHEGEEDQALTPLQPMYTRLLAQVASLPGKPMGVMSPSSLSPAHHSPQPSQQQYQHQQQVHELVSSISQVQQQDLGLIPAAQLLADPTAVLAALTAVQRSMAPSLVRPVLPPIPPFTLHSLTQHVSGSCRRSSVSSTSSLRELIPLALVSVPLLLLRLALC